MIGTTKASELLGISDRRVRELISEGRIPGACKIGRNWVIPTVNGYPKVIEASHGPKSTWKKVKTPAKNVININRELIGNKMDDGQYAPPISAKCRNENIYSSRVYIPGPCFIIYNFENPHSGCGARAWIETCCEPISENGCTFQEIMDKNPKPIKRKAKSKKGFGKKANNSKATASSKEAALK